MLAGGGAVVALAGVWALRPLPAVVIPPAATANAMPEIVLAIVLSVSFPNLNEPIKATIHTSNRKIDNQII